MHFNMIITYSCANVGATFPSFAHHIYWHLIHVFLQHSSSFALFVINMAHKRDVGRATEYYFWNQCDVLSSLSMAFANFGRGLSIVAYSDCFVNDYNDFNFNSF